MANDDYTIKKARKEIDALTRRSGFGRTYGAIGDLYKGIDHRHAGSSFQKNTDHQGLTFFTRPYLNLSYNNVLADRVLLPLLDTNTVGTYRAIRASLDPKGNHESALIDQRSAFIPLLTNTLESISGFPDVVINAYTSTEGMRKESYSQIDDVAEINGVYDITANFTNIQGDPITDLFYYWARYGGNVYTGDMVPYPEMVIENRVDYQTRIWRITLDATKRYVKRIGCANACFPLAAPLGASFNFDRSRPYVEDNNQISIPLRCTGAEYSDPILYLEFNDTVAMFNPGMADGRREGSHHKLTNTEINAFNFQGYPWINIQTLELEWWVDREEYALMRDALTNRSTETIIA